jgi:hypothetical protein
MGHQVSALLGHSGIEVAQKVDGHALKSHRPSGDALEKAVGFSPVALGEASGRLSPNRAGAQAHPSACTREVSSRCWSPCRILAFTSSSDLVSTVSHLRSAGCTAQVRGDQGIICVSWEPASGSCSRRLSRLAAARVASSLVSGVSGDYPYSSSGVCR